VQEKDEERIEERRKYGTGAREPNGHCMRPSHFLFLVPEGGEKARLGGELRREEQLISRRGVH
jgi:hypothetical protein